MPVNPANYDHRGGGNYGVVLRLVAIVASDRLVYFDHNRNRGSWVIRDFITDLRLDNEHSHLAVQEIEADASDDEFPIWCNAEQEPNTWKSYLEFRTSAVLRTRRPPTRPTSPNSASGSWQPI